MARIAKVVWGRRLYCIFRKSAAVLCVITFVVNYSAFCKLRSNFGSFCSVNHLSGPLRKQMFTCDWCISIHFVSVFQGSLLVIALFRIVSKLFMIFLILVFSNNKAMSASCPQQKFHSSSRFRSLFLSSLGSFSILFLRAKLGECVALWFALTPPPLKWLTEQKNQFVICKHAARYNEFGYKTFVARIAKVVWGRRLYCIFRKSAAVLCVPT